MSNLLLSSKKVESMTPTEKINYFTTIKNYCLEHKTSTLDKSPVIRRVAGKLAPAIRNYDFEIIGKENIPQDGRVLFAANHSNAHDFFTMEEVFNSIGMDQTFLASNEDLSPLILAIFRSCGGVLFDRKDKEAANQAFLDFTSNIVNGMPGIIYPESTWNLHPYKPMHLIKVGVANIAAIANVKIVPVIYEYVEVPKLCAKESQIFSKCVVKFGKPIEISPTESMFKQTDIILKAMEQTRLQLWEDLGIMKKSLADVNQDVYLNHTYLKKFGGAGEYDSLREQPFLLVKDQLSSENEYHLNENGEFVPGILTKEEGQKYILKK